MSQLKRGLKERIMYIENKSEGLSGDARIGRVTFSRTGKTLYYRGRSLATLRGLDEWTKGATNDTLIDEAASIVERFAAGVNVEQLTENVVRALGVDLSLSDPTLNSIARALVLRHQDEVLELERVVRLPVSEQHAT